MATFYAKSNEFLVNNNVLSNYQHTEHISTTEPLYLDGMAGSDNIVHKQLRGAKASFGDYLLSDLKTIVAQADLKDELKADVVGVCIGQNPVNKKLVFWNVDCMTSDEDLYQFYNVSPGKFDATKFTTMSKGEGEPIVLDEEFTLYINRDIFGGEKGYIMASAPMSIENPEGSQEILHPGEFGGLLNTIEWYKQAKNAGFDFTELEGTKGTIKHMLPAIKRIMQMSGVTSLDDSYNGWFLGSVGHMSLLCPDTISSLTGAGSERSVMIFNALLRSVSNLGRGLISSNTFWGSTFGVLLSGSYIFALLYSPNELIFTMSPAKFSLGLFALIEVSGTYIESDINTELGTDTGEDPGTDPGGYHVDPGGGPL